MKQKLFASFALCLILIGTVFVPIVSAQLGPFLPQQPQNPSDFGPQLPTTAVNDPDLAQSQQQNPDDENGDGCSWNEFGCQIVMALSNIMTGTPLLLAMVTGMVLDYSLYNSIQSSTYTKYDGTTGDEGFVVKGWKLVRDFSNLVFIFALFVVAFILILGLDNGGQGALQLDPKKTVARVIIMALLVNFSFFLGRMVIETTNVFAGVFYTKIVSAPDMKFLGQEQTDIQSFYSEFLGVKSISIGILSIVNPQTFALKNNLQNPDLDFTASFSNYATIIFYSAVTGAFSLFLIYIFLSVAFLFIARTIGLFIGIILSPLAFVSYTIPFLRKQNYLGFDDWMKQFLGLAFMAPIFMFFLYIGLEFFNIPLGKDSGFLSSAAQIVIKFAMIGFFLILAKRITKDLSGKVGAMVTGAVTSIVTTGAMVAGAVATGGASAGLAVARQAGTRAVTGLAGKVVGDERASAIQQRLASTNFRSIGTTFKDAFTNNRNTNALSPSFAQGGTTNIGKMFKDYGASLAKTTADLAKLSGSKVPGQLEKAFERGKKGPDALKQLFARADSMSNARDNKEKKVGNINAQINDLRTKYSEAKSPADRGNIADQIKKLTQEKNALTNPSATQSFQKASRIPIGTGTTQNASVGTLNVQKLVVGNKDDQPETPPHGVLSAAADVQHERSQKQTSHTSPHDEKTPAGHAQNLLAGISGIKDPGIGDRKQMDFSATLDTPDTHDFGGIQLPGQDDEENDAFHTYEPTRPDNLSHEIADAQEKTTPAVDMSSAVETPGDFGGIQLPSDNQA